MKIVLSLGDVLTGTKSSLEDFIEFYHSTISVVPHETSKRVLGYA